MARTVELVPLDELAGAPVNPKEHDEEGIERSIEAFGIIDLITMDERTSTIISGHGRRDSLRARKAAGKEPPDDVEVDELGRWLVPVIRGWASIDDSDRDAALIAVNRLTETGGWRTEDLVQMLDNLRDTPFLEATGYGATELDDMFKLLAPPSLDDLEKQHGDPDPERMWPVLRFKVAPSVRDRYLKIIDGIEGGDDTLFEQLLTWAEAGRG